jgi:DNA-binding NarL/FixJ family response regulator
MIKLLVCDDHEVVRTALVRVLLSDPLLSVLAEAASREQLLEAIANAPTANLLLLDLNLGAAGVSAGIALIQTVRELPGAPPVLVLSMHGEPEIVSRAITVGARGYVSKASSIDVLQEAIRQVHAGRLYLDPMLVEPVLRQRERPDEEPWNAALTPREREVMQMLCAGQRVSDIATVLGLSIKTVSTHKVRLMEKLDITNNADLIKLGMRQGLA